MKDLFTVMEFTMKDMLTRKSFIITTIIILVMIVIGFNIPNIVKALDGENEGSKMLIIDEENVFEGSLQALSEMDLGYKVEISNTEISMEDIKNKIENKEIDNAILIEKDNEKVKVKYIVENVALIEEVPENIMSILNNTYSNLQISKLGLTEEQLSSLKPDFEYSLEQVEEKEVKGNIFVMMILSIVLFFAIYFCAYQVSSSITTEKTSKVMETLVTSTKPTTIVAGKTIGIAIVGLIQIASIIIVALISANLFLDSQIISSIIDISQITPFLGLVTIMYFLLGYFVFAFLYALTGSIVSKPEDVQSAGSVVAVVAVIGFYLAYFSMINPTSNINIFASIFPFSSPFCMPQRVMMGVATGWEIAFSILVLLATIFVIAKIAIKIYSNAILNYGTKMDFKTILKICKDKN